MPKKSGTKPPTSSNTAPQDKPVELASSANANTIEDEDAETNSAPAKEVDKKQAADLEKMTDFHEDKDEMNEISKESLGNLMGSTQAPQKRVRIKQEDIRMIMEELEVNKYLAEKKVVEHDGDIKAAMRDIMGF